MRFLLDTNVVMHLANHAKGYENILANLRRVTAAQCALSAMSAYEVRYAIQRGPGRVKKENIERLEIAFQSMAVLPVTGAIAEAAAIVRAELVGKGIGIGEHDSIIAAHAQALGLICVTDNEKHFSRVRGLALKNWRVA